MVRAYFETYGLPVTITNCANNFGPFHEPEKLFPRFITNLLQDQKVPLMGKGENIREWLYARDHAAAIDLVLQKGVVGETYCVGGESKTNYEATKLILKFLGKDESYIEYVEDRLGHDFRYAIDDSKLRALGWEPEHTFEEWLEKTVAWYKDNEWWWRPLLAQRVNVDREQQEKMRY
jgi:dTDP-glucose 4,6-dehydratase